MSTQKGYVMANQAKHQALSEPQFIIESGGIYYLTLSVWAYDPNASGMKPAEADAANAIKSKFGDLKAKSPLVAVEVPDAQMYMAMIT
jgi:hypothetical protein